jgi:hypothetical protein
MQSLTDPASQLSFLPALFASESSLARQSNIGKPGKYVCALDTLRRSACPQCLMSRPKMCGEMITGTEFRSVDPLLIT